MAKIVIVYASAGHGHKRIAEALHQEFLEMPHLGAEVELLDILQYANPVFRRVYPGIYYLLVRYAPRLWGFGFRIFSRKWILRMINPLRIFLNSLQVRRLTQKILRDQPDWIIHTHYLMPGVLAPFVLKGKLKSRMITIVTDFRVHGFWVNPAQELYVGMCEATRRDLVSRGVPSDRIELWGIPVHPKFRKHLGRPLLMREFGLSEDRQTVLITSGSFGFASIPGLLECLERLPGKIQLIFVAGANQKLYETLKNRTFRIPALILGYANNMDQLMEVSDVALVKPGGSTVCELLVKACPFFMMKPIPGQEEGNGEVLVMAGISHYITSTKDLLEKWSLLTDPQAAKRLRTAIAEFAKPEAGLRIAEFVKQEMSHGA